MGPPPAADAWPRVLGRVALVCCLLLAAPATAAPLLLPQPVNAAASWQNTLLRFQAHAARRARDYERTQDIRADQLLVLLDVAERTDYSLGQLLATGEHESAHTWNDFVRPPLGGGRLGSAAGVWQFQPRTFERIIHHYGDELLAITAADPSAGRRRLDLGFGPFCDGHVRLIVRDTMAGLRDPDDAELKLLRHNFTILALAKVLLSRDSGASDPVEDYLFHFLGAAEGRRVLTLARGDARHTRTVKPPPQPDAPPAVAATGRVRDSLPGRPAVLLELAPRGYTTALPSLPRPGARAADAMLRAPGEAAPVAAAPQWPAPHGYAHDSPVVTGNAGMFYRDGASRSDPYTWAEFLSHLKRRVKADRQPALVRAKYGVGFALTGGDTPRWRFEPGAAGARSQLSLTLRRANGGGVAAPRARLTAPLDRREMQDYQRRLAALIALGQAAPSAVLSDAAARALWRLGLLERPESSDLAAQGGDAADPIARFGTDMGVGFGTVLRTDHPAVREALHDFRALVGKAPPDDPAHADLLLPAERVALEVYAARIERILAAEPAD